MARVEVTPQLCATIKAIRTKNNIRSNALAKHLNKSTAYITKLEQCEILTIDQDTLVKLFNFVMAGDRSDNDMIVEIFNSLKMKYTQEEIEEQLWFENFDTTTRLLPIPSELIDEFNCLIVSLGISRSELLSRINANEALNESLKKSKKYPTNQWFQVKGPETVQRVIKIHLTIDELDAILDKKQTECTYIYLQVITFYLFKIRQFNQQVDIGDMNYNELFKQASEFLSKYKVYSLVEKEKLLREAQTEADRERVLNSFDITNRDIVAEIFSGFDYWSVRDIKQANIQFASFLKNMQWDLSFMMKLISFPFSDLSRASYTNKKLLIEEIRQVLERYQEMPADDRSIEEY